MLKSKITHLKETYKFCFDHFWEKRTIFILIKKTRLKIKKLWFPANNARCEKMLRSKIVHLKEIYNFYFDHFLIKRTVFVLIVKSVIINIKNLISRTNSATYETNVKEHNIVRFKRIYKFCFDHFLIGIIVFLINI